MRQGSRGLLSNKDGVLQVWNGVTFCEGLYVGYPGLFQMQSDGPCEGSLSITCIEASLGSCFYYAFEIMLESIEYMKAIKNTKI